MHSFPFVKLSHFEIVTTKICMSGNYDMNNVCPMPKWWVYARVSARLPERNTTLQYRLKNDL